MPPNLGNHLAQIEQRLQLGHSKKAERALSGIIGAMPVQELVAEEPAIRTILAKFLPAHKARYKRIEDLLKQRLAERAVQIETPPKAKVAGSSTQQEARAPRLPSTDVRFREFQALVEEMRPLGFTKSAQVSKYIIERQLWNKYSNISGILIMERDGDQWPFVGGFPPEIYARLCEALGLGNEGTSAKPVNFVSFSDLQGGE